MRLATFHGRRNGWVMLLLVSLIVCSAGAIAQTWTNLRAIEYGYAISKATTQRARLRESNRRLRVELALLKSPARVSGVAAAAGLRPPEPQQVRRLQLAQRRDATSPDVARHEE